MSPPIRRNAPRPVATPRPTPQPVRPEARPAPQRPAAQQQTQRDRWEGPINAVNRVANGVKSISDAVGATQTRTTNGVRTVGPVAVGGHGRIVEGRNTATSRWAGGVSTAAGAAQLPGAIYTAARDVRQALRTRSAEDINTALGSVAGAGSTAVSVAKGGLETVGNVRNYQLARNAASEAFSRAAPQAGRQVTSNVARAAAREAVDGASRQVVRSAARAAAGNGLRGAANVGANAARAALRNGGSAVARAAGRFAPGANVAIAVLDTAAAASTLRDPNASTGKKVASVVTAAGSWLAASNVPGVSQAGAVVSTVSSFIGSFL